MSQSVDAVMCHGNQQKMPHTPTSAVSVGTLLSFGTGTQRLVAVANEDIPANTRGDVETDAVYHIKKKTGVSFVPGQTVEWDEATSRAVDNADGSGDFAIGVCWHDGGAAAADDTVRVRLNKTFSEQTEGSSG